MDFSRAGMDTYQALNKLTPEQRDQLIVVNCGFAKAIPSNLAHKIRNVTSTSDPIPSLMDSGACLGLKRDLIKVWETDEYNVIKSPELGNSLFTGHSFANKTYQTDISQSFDKLFPKYGVYDENK